MVSPGIGTKMFMGLVVVGLLAAGWGGLKTYLDKTNQARELEENGVLADADVSSATLTSGRRIEEYATLRVSFDPPGPKFLEFAEVKDCSGARWERGIETVRVVYLPDNPEVIALEACRSNFDANILPGILGAVFLVLGLLLLWRLRGFWRS
ncbi:MAG: DUF3592 domain-containing protein [Actinomycetota bacterium]